MKEKEQTIQDKLQSRPPVVVVLGHVDHGKTSILDYIREEKIAETETAGITQHTGAYQVEQNGENITFIDTPGHEAFSAMRSRGASVADLAILVVAADDGVMPQTKESISVLQKEEIPYIVAINKIDKPGADPQKAKNDLLQEGITLEGYGGKTPNVEVSAKTGQGIDNLLDMINLVSEVEEFKCDPEKKPELVVVEYRVDKNKGPIATLIVKDGTVRVGDVIAGDTAWAKIKRMENFAGKEIQEAGPSYPVVLLGFSGTPRTGEKFFKVADVKEAEKKVESTEKKTTPLAEESMGDEKVLNIILKSDAEGTLEAVKDVLDKIEAEKVRINVLKEMTGEINDSDIRLAQSSDAIVIGFRVEPNNVARGLAEQHGVSIIKFDAIYDLEEKLRKNLIELIDPVVVEEDVGKLKILKIFLSEPSRKIVGGKITEGELRPGVEIKVMRNKEQVGKGKLKELRSEEKKINKAQRGEEVGVLFDGNTNLQEGDILEAFETKTIQPGLE